MFETRVQGALYHSSSGRISVKIDLTFNKLVPFVTEYVMLVYIYVHYGFSI